MLFSSYKIKCTVIIILSVLYCSGSIQAVEASPPSQALTLRWLPTVSWSHALTQSVAAAALSLSLVDAEGRLLDSSIAKVLQGPLPSNTLQDRWHVQFIGDTIYPSMRLAVDKFTISCPLISVTDLDVLPSCEFNAVYAQARTMKRYSAPYAVCMIVFV